MTKHGLIETIKSVFGHHIDPEKHEEFKGTNIEMEDKVQKILKLIKEKDVEDSNQEPLVELVEDFFKHYQTLYARYDHLTGELRDKVHAKKSKDDSSSSSSSDSDSDHSPRKKGTKNGKSIIEFQRIAESVKQELEGANLEIGELKRRIGDLCAEKDSLLLEKEVAMNCVEEEKKTSRDLKHEKEALEEKVANFSRTLNAAEEENKALSLKTEELSSEVKQAQDKIAELVAEISGHKNESTTRIRDLELNLDSLTIQKSEIEKQKDDELSSLVMKLEEKERDSLSQIQKLTKELETNKESEEKILEEKEGRILELESAFKELQKKMEDGENEASVQNTALVAEVSKLEHEMSSLSAQKNESETRLEKQTEEISDYLNEIQSLKDQVAKKIVEQQQMVEEKNSYISQVKELEDKLIESKNEVSSLQKKLEESENEASARIAELKTQIGKFEEEISSLHAKLAESGVNLEKTTGEISDYVILVQDLKEEKEVLQVKVVELEAILIEKGSEISSLQKKIEDTEHEATARITELTAEIGKMEAELSSLNAWKSESESQLEKQKGEMSDYINLAQELKEEKATLEVKISELEAVLVEKGIEISSLQKRTEDRENEASGRIILLTAEIGKLEAELSSLNAWKSESESQLEKQKGEISDFTNLAQELKEEKATLEAKISELEAVLVEKGTEISSLQKRTEDGENEASGRIILLKAEIGKMEAELSSLNAWKSESKSQLEKQKGEMSDFINLAQELKEEKATLEIKISELEAVLVEKGIEISSLQKRTEDGENEASGRIILLTAEIGKLEAELSSLNAWKSESESQLEKQKGEISDFTNLAQELKEEKATLEAKISELEAVLVEKGTEISSLQKRTEDGENEASGRIILLTAEIGKIEAELSSLNAWKSESKSQLEKQKGEMSDFINLAQELKEEKATLEVKISELEAVLVEKGIEISSLQKRTEDGENEASGRIILLTAEIGKLEAELSSLNAWKSESESQLEKQKGEISDFTNLAQELKEEKATLEAKISELEAVLVEKGTEISSLQKRTEDGENEASGRTILLTAEIGKLEAELSSLNAWKRESESQLEKQKGEISDYVILVQDLKEDMAKKNADEMKFIEEKEAFVLQVKQLEDELKSEQELKNKSVEEKDLLQAKVLELEVLLMEKENDISSLRKKNENAEVEASARITALTAEISSLNALKAESESELEKQKGEILDYVVLFQALKEEKEALEVKVVELKKGNEILMEKGNEISSLLKKTEDAESDASGRIMALTAEIGKLTAELSSLKTEFEAQLEKQKVEISDYVIQVQDSKEETAKKIAEVENLMQEKEAVISQVKELEGGLSSARELKSESEEEKGVLQVKILGLEAILIEKENELSSLQKKTVDAENEASAQIAALTAEVAKLEAEISALNALKTESESLIENQKGEISDSVKLAQALKEENEVLQVKVAELEAVIQEKVNEISTIQKNIEEAENKISGNLIEIENLKEQLENKGADNRKLQAAILETETILTERGSELSFLQKKSEDGESQVSNLQEEINSLTSQKTELQSKCEKKSGEISEFVILVDNLREEQRRSVEENEDLVLRVKNLDKEVESLCNEKNGFEEQVKNKIMEIESLQRKLDEVKNESDIQIEALFVQIKGLKTDADSAISDHGEILKAAEKKIQEMEETIEDLKGDAEIKAEEISTLVENVRNLEVKIRLSNQKLRITEQMLTEKEDDHKNKESKLHQENKLFEERIAALNGVIATYKATQVKVRAEIDEKVNKMFLGIDTLTVKFEEDYGHIETCIFEILKELQIAKNLVKKTRGEKEKLEKELERKESEKENLKKSVKLLEAKVIEKDANMGELKENLNEKDRGMLGLGEEKKEAIRQLCIWIEYHRSRCDDLKEMLSKTTGARRQIRA